MKYVLFLLGLVLTSSIHANNFTVTNNNNSGTGSLRQAIIDANAASGAPHTITFNAAYTITLTSALSAITKDITINSTGSNVITINGFAGSSILTVNTGVTAIFNYLTLQGASGSIGSAAAINTSGNLTLNYCTIQNNTTTNTSAAGAIFSNAAGVTITINNSIIQGNSGTRATISVNFNTSIATLNITNSIIKNNTNSSTSNYGGGIYSTAITTITNSEISGNAGPRGAGIALGIGNATNKPTLNIIRSTISGNSTNGGSNLGGGIYVQGTSSNFTGNCTFSNCTISGNTATTGGGVNYGGGGTNAWLSVGTFNNCTITGNVSQGNIATSKGGGIDQFTAGSGVGFVVLNYCLVAGNNPSSTDNSRDIYVTSASLGSTIGRNLYGGSITGTYSGGFVTAGNVVLTNAISTVINTTLADNGGTTQLPGGGYVKTHALLAPSTQSALNPSAATTGLASLDQLGNTRDELPDIGAFESSLSKYTWTGSTSNDFTVSTNWSPNRSTSTTYDILRFTSSPSGTITNVPTQTVALISLSNNAAVDFQAATGAARTLTVGGYLSVANGATMRLATGAANTDVFNITLGTNSTASIEGTLRLDSTFTNTYSNTYNTASGITTFTGTGALIYGGGTLTGATATSLIFQTGSTITHASLIGTYGPGISFTFPTATYSGVNVNINTQYTSGSTSFVFPSAVNAINNLTWATSAAVGAPSNPDFRLRLPSGSQNFTIAGNLSINTVGAAAGSSIQVDSFNSTTYLNVIKIGGNLSVGSTSYLYLGRNTQNDTVLGNVNLSGTARIFLLNSVSPTSNPNAICRLVVYGNYTQTGNTTFFLNNSTSKLSQGIFELKGNFHKNGNIAGGFATASSNLGVSGKILFSGTSQQSFAINAFNSNNRALLEINNPAGVALAQYDNSGTPTNSTLILDSAFILTNGRFIVGSHTFTLNSTASILPSTPTSSSYIDVSTGKFTRNSVPSAGNTIFPIGTSTSYTPLVFTGGTTGRNITVSVKNAFTKAVNAPNGLVNVEWSIKANAATSPTITFQYNEANKAASFSASGAVLGIVKSDATTWVESALGAVAGSNPFTQQKTALALSFDTATFYGIGNSSAFVPATTYTWLGGVNGSYATPSNWNPNRPSGGASTDILLVNTGGAVTITDVPTESFAQFNVTNNTVLSLQSLTGAARTLTLTGGLSIASGSSLRLATGAATGDALNIAFSGSPSATIAGSLIIDSSFNGQYANSYIATNSTTTVTGTITNTGVITSSSNNLLFSSGSTYIHNRPDGTVNQGFPNGNFTNANVKVQALVNPNASGSTQITNFPTVMASLDWNTPLITGNAGARITVISGSSLTINGNANFAAGSNSSTIAFANATVNTVYIAGNLSTSTINLAIGRGTMNFTVNGNLTVNSGSLELIGTLYSGSSAVTSSLTVNGNVTINNVAFLRLNSLGAASGSLGACIANLNVKGNFTKVSGSTFTTTTNAGQTGNLVLNGTTAQTVNATGGFTNSPNLIVNNPSGVTLTGAAVTIGSLTLTSGTLSTSNNLTVTGASLVNNTTLNVNNTLTLSGTVAQTISGTTTIPNFTINNAAGVTVSSGANKLNITGTLTLQSGAFTTNGNVVLKSTSIANSAVVAPVGTGGNTGTISGTVHVERFIPKGYRAWRDMAPSVFNAGSIYNNWQETGSYANNGYGLFITGTTAATNAHAVDATTGLDQTTNSVKSAYTFTNGTWNAVTNTKTTNLNPFLGYRLLVRGDRSFNLYTTPISTVGTTGWLLMNAATALRAKGNLITGNVVYSTSGITNAVAGATYSSASFGLNSSSTTGFSSVANPYVAPIDWKNIWDNNRAVNLTANYYYLDPTIGSTGAYVSYNAVTDATSNGAIGSRRYIQAGQAFFVENNNSTAPSLTITEADKAIGSSKTSVFGNTNRSRLTISLMKSTGSELKKMDGATVVFDPSFSNGIGSEDARKMTNPSENLAIIHDGQSLSIEGRQPATTAERLPLSLSQLANSEYQLTIDATAYQSDNLQLYLVDAFKKGETLLTSGINNISFTIEANNPATYANRFSVVFKAANKAATTATPIVSSTLNVYPNPLVGKTITVRLGSEAAIGKYVVKVYNGLGQKVHSGVYNYTGSVISCKLPEALAKGGYQLTVQQEGKVIGKSNLIVE